MTSEFLDQCVCSDQSNYHGWMGRRAPWGAGHVANWFFAGSHVDSDKFALHQYFLQFEVWIDNLYKTPSVPVLFASSSLSSSFWPWTSWNITGHVLTPRLLYKLGKVCKRLVCKFCLTPSTAFAHQWPWKWLQVSSAYPACVNHFILTGPLRRFPRHLQTLSYWNMSAKHCRGIWLPGQMT